MYSRTSFDESIPEHKLQAQCLVEELIKMLEDKSQVCAVKFFKIGMWIEIILCLSVQVHSFLKRTAVDCKSVKRASATCKTC